MKALTFYTVLIEQGYPVKYCHPRDRASAVSYGAVETFAVQCSDPGEACGEFEAWVGKELCCYLDPAQFQAKVAALCRLRRNAEQKLATWNAMLVCGTDDGTGEGAR